MLQALVKIERSTFTVDRRGLAYGDDAAYPLGV
jgi:hypothetical protein